MKRYLKQLLLIILPFSLLVSACSPSIQCSDPLGCVTVGASDPVVIAAVFPFTGDERAAGSAAYEAVIQAAKDQEYVLGHSVYVIKEDYDCSSADNQETAARLAGNDSIVAVIGPTCATGDPQFNQAIADAGILHLVITDPPVPAAPGNSLIPLSISNPQNGDSGQRDRSPAGLAYDGAQLVFIAVEKAGSGAAQQKLIIPRQALRQTLLNLKSINARSGVWTCTAESGCTVEP